MFTFAELEDVIPLVRSSILSTSQYAWPLLRALTGVEVARGAGSMPGMSAPASTRRR
jgi:hypothetical protein